MPSFFFPNKVGKANASSPWTSCWYVKVFTYSENVFNNKCFEKVPLDKIDVTKKALFFLSQAPTHHSFTSNSPFLYELKTRFVSLKECVGFSIFDSIWFLSMFMFC